MTIGKDLTPKLQKLVLRLEDDLRTRLDEDAKLKNQWQSEHTQALHAERTSSSWVSWRDDRVTQAAVGWVLTTVFLRFCEDNALLSKVWISGPGARRQEAFDAENAYFRAYPENTWREWILEGIAHLQSFPSTAPLVDEHAALWQVSPSGAMAKEILDFWRATDEASAPLYNFQDSELSTRFLGDLYQDLSEYAKKTFALLQTPVFVEEFILDQTLSPALAERPLEGFKLIDPTCGSGHFLLGAFHRLMNVWDAKAPNMETRDRVQKALNSIHGTDLNPFAIAIARFRLTIAALQATGERNLERAPDFTFHLATGDSLLHGQTQQELRFDEFDADAELSGFSYATEDLEQLKQILAPGQYDVVVGNPPYITVKDRTLNRHYRKLYSSCKGTYPLSVPFMERFFHLAKRGTPSQRAGWMGQITSNSFMKRGFGVKLIEDLLPSLDLCTLIDSEGAWIPGHNTDGTPTTIVIGRNQPPTSTTVRAALSMGKRETRSAADNGERPYWNGIANFIDHPDGYHDDWISISDIPRTALAAHPWVLGGGGVTETMGLVARHQVKLRDLISGEIGRAVRIGADEPYLRDRPGHGPESRFAVPILTGAAVRDYLANANEYVLYPYKTDETDASALTEYLWPYRALLRERSTFSGNMEDAGRKWWEFMQHTASAYETPLSIAFANVASHNHFGLNRGNTVFSSHAPVIKLAANATGDDHFAILGVLNTSITCFWMRQLSQPKGGAAGQAWSRTYEFTGGTVEALPVPRGLPVDDARRMNEFAETLEATVSSIPKGEITGASLAASRSACESVRRQMIALQEELDWEFYRLYGLMDEKLTYSGKLPEIQFGQRAFEIDLSRNFTNGHGSVWFTQSGCSPINEIPPHWPSDYRELVQRRLDVIETNPSIRLLENPEYKRKWAGEPWEKLQKRILRRWILDRLEDRSFWFDAQDRPIPRSISQLADAVSRDSNLVRVLALWVGTIEIDITRSLTQLLTDESVPYLAAQRLNEAGIRKREVWEQTWDRQRLEDAGHDSGKFPVPAPYKNTDFRKPVGSKLDAWWKLRGKLDVARERFIVYPDAGRSTDPTLLLGWAGWDRVQQFLVLATIMDERVAEGAHDAQLVPLIAGMAELVPWVKQWHADLDPTFGMSMADFCSAQLEERMTQLNVSTTDLKAWRPGTATRGRSAVKENT